MSGKPLSPRGSRRTSYLGMSALAIILLLWTTDRVDTQVASSTITTVAGNGSIGFSGNGGQATSAMLNYPAESTATPPVAGPDVGSFPRRAHYTGYMRVGDDVGALPIGSHLDAAAGTFTWQPGVGFLHAYDLVFVRWAGGRAVARRDIRIVLHPKGSNRVGPQVVIDTPAPNANVARSLVIAGWALDVDHQSGTGIDAVRVWAYPARGGDPVFVGAASYGGARPDVAAVYGERFTKSGYGIVVDSLPRGTYDLAVFAWSTVKNGFIPARVVRVTVR